MFERVEKHIKEQVEGIVFIELKEEAKDILERFPYMKDISMPILVKELSQIVKGSGNEMEGISIRAFIRGMIFIMGLDQHFKFNPVYKRFLKNYDSKIEDYLSYEGLKLAEAEELNDALIYFKALLFINQENINGFYNYGRCCQDIALKTDDEEKIKDYTKEAIEVFEALIEKYPDFAGAYYYLGFHYANQKLFKKAQLIWEKAVELGLDEEKAKEVCMQIESLRNHIQYEEGYNLVLNNRPQEGLEKLFPLEENNKEWWNLLFFIALAHRQLGNFSEAIAYLERIIKINPSQADTYNELGLCYAEIRNFTKAEKYLKKALTLQENDSEILCNLGMLYIELGRYDLAETYLNESYTLNPEDPITRQCMEQLNLVYSKHR